MISDVYVFGDSHWRVFFPFVNHEVTTGLQDAVTYEENGIRTIDTTGNGLSGSTMYGLLNPNSRHQARNTILRTLDGAGGVDNVGLAFGEVDARYHNTRYFEGRRLLYSRVYETVERYWDFIKDDLIDSGRVRRHIFVYYGYAYPHAGNTLLQPGQPMGIEAWQRACMVHQAMYSALPTVLSSLMPRVRLIFFSPSYNDIAADGVHLIPEKVYWWVNSQMSQVLNPPEIPY